MLGDARFLQRSMKQSFSGWEPKKLFTRSASGRFQEVASVEGFESRADGRSLAADDFDGDGDLDLLMFSRNAPRLQLFENVGSGGNALELELRQHQGHRDADGAVVHVAGVGAFPVVLARGYATAVSPRVHVGLGARTGAEVSVQWRDGTREAFGALASGALYRLEQGAGRAETLRAFAPRKARAPVRWPAALTDVVPGGKGATAVQLFMESCKPCRAEVPALNALHAQGVQVVGLGLHPPKELAGVKQRLGIRYPVAPLPGAIAEAFEGPQGLQLPTVLLYGADGKLARIATGAAKLEWPGADASP
ncbi:MAG: ASPIC/UnbV domain-containing protein [Archangiaceae bacterium]|nr:ASPIC/UnbV domain-containing protein [Archangiaceae bacterium]